jgi:ATP-dependent exoDNAse (exonuclease V) beta subunit
MIEKNVSVHKKSVTRILNLDPTSKRVNINDNRFYSRNEDYYPSVTSILQFLPKGKFFETWLKDVGHNSDIIARKAADEGTQVHEAVEKYLMGEKIQWLDENDKSNYSLDVWKLILKFHDFWSTVKPILIESEIHLFSDQYKFAGTCDLVVEIEGERWLLDLKTSNSIHTAMDLQLAAYTQAWNETFEEKIDRVGIIWLKSSKRKEGKLQGKGWEIYEPSRNIEDNFKLFEHVHELFKLENPNPKPNIDTYPIEIQLDPNIYDKTE